MFALMVVNTTPFEDLQPKPQNWAYIHGDMENAMGWAVWPAKIKYTERVGPELIKQTTSVARGGFR